VSYFIKITQTRFVAVSLVMPLFAACSFNMNQNPLMERVVQSLSLDDGKILYAGYKSPDPDAQCQLINETSRNWYVAKTVGQFKAGGGRQVLQEDAIASVKQRPQEGINYIALMIPNETNIGVVDVTAGQDAKTSYFRCVNPPQPH
jgi:hypothetical protein